MIIKPFLICESATFIIVIHGELNQSEGRPSLPTIELIQVRSLVSTECRPSTPNDSRPQFQEGVMDRDHGSVAAVGPERAGDAARDEGPADEQRHDAAAPLRNLHTQGREQSLLLTCSLWLALSYIASISILF